MSITLHLLFVTQYYALQMSITIFKNSLNPERLSSIPRKRNSTSDHIAPLHYPVAFTLRGLPSPTSSPEVA